MADPVPHLLLVDDDALVLRLMATALTAHPDVRFATSGENALHSARRAPPALIVLDIEMPGMGGFALCDALKADPLLAHIPVIVATSHLTPAIEVAALAHGAVDFVCKPIVPALLAARVDAQLRMQRLMKALMREAQDKLPRSRPRSRARPLLLIVDDNLAAIRSAELALAGLGDIHVTTAGAAALADAERLMPDLILLDIHLPGLDGAEVCERLKAGPASGHVPVVFVGRSADTALEARALELGAADFIAKPFNATVLRARVRNLLDQKCRIDLQLREMGEHWRHISDARVTAIVAAASPAILSHGADGRIVLANAAASRLLRMPALQLVGSEITSVLGHRLPQPANETDPGHRLVLMRGDGERFPAEVSVSWSESGAEGLTTIVLRDVSERELLDAERVRRAELETEALATYRALAAFAHELGNPLNAVLGFGELMAADTAHPLPEAQASRLKLVLSSGERLRSLLADVRAFGRAQHADFTVAVRTVDVIACVESAVASVAALTARSGVTLSCRFSDESLWVTADSLRLVQCLLNLVTNAIKYNTAGGSVVVAVEGASSTVSLSVQDSGPGMDESQCNRLFEPFNRLGRESGETPGTGLGLVITRQLVRAMHGSLNVRSTPGQGSCFSIVLPRAEPAPAPPAPALQKE